VARLVALAPIEPLMRRVQAPIRGRG